MIAVFAALVVVGLGASAAGAQVTIVDVGNGYNHDEPGPDGGFSSAEWCFGFSDPALIGQTVTLTVRGPDGDLTGEGVVAESGIVRVLVGIFDGGEYTARQLDFSNGDGVDLSAGGFGDEITEALTNDVEFDPSVISCLTGFPTRTMPEPTVVPDPTEVPEPTEVPAAEPTEVPTAQPTSEPTAPAAAESTAAPAGGGDAGDAGDDDGPTDGGGSNGGWIGLGIGGIMLAAVGAALAFGAKKAENCDEELRAWNAAKAAYKEAVDAIDPAEKKVAEAGEARKLAAAALAKAKAKIPPDPNGDSVTDEGTGETVTSLDRWLRDNFANDEYNRYTNDRTPENALAFEAAMRAADTPEARTERRAAGERARQAAIPVQAAFDAAQQAERDAEAALQRRHRDAASEARMAEAAKKRYEECIGEQAAWDEQAEKDRKKYQDAVERDRKRREREREGGPPSPPLVSGGPEEILPGGPCSPLGSTMPSTTTFTGDVVADNDTVTITIERSDGPFIDDELEADTDDPFLSMLGANGRGGAGAGTRTATLTMPAAEAAGLNANALFDAFNARQVQVQDDMGSTRTRQITVTFTWDYYRVEAKCVKTLRCDASGWTSTGPGNYSDNRSATNHPIRSVVFGNDDPRNDLTRIISTIGKHVQGRKDMLDLQLRCSE